MRRKSKKRPRPDTGEASVDGEPPPRRRARESAAEEEAAQEKEVISPLIAILEAGVAAHTVVKNPAGNIYTGFAFFHDMKNAQCEFESMSSNRCVNEDVVAHRVGVNLRHKAETGAYTDFGQLVAGE